MSKPLDPNAGSPPKKGTFAPKVSSSEEGSAVPLGPPTDAQIEAAAKAAYEWDSRDGEMLIVWEADEGVQNWYRAIARECLQAAAGVSLGPSAAGVENERLREAVQMMLDADETNDDGGRWDDAVRNARAALGDTPGCPKHGTRLALDGSCDVCAAAVEESLGRPKESGRATGTGGNEPSAAAAQTPFGLGDTPEDRDG